jgi:hypothetical protein
MDPNYNDTYPNQHTRDMDKNFNDLLDEYCNFLKDIQDDPLNIVISLKGKSYTLKEIDASSYLIHYRNIKPIDL